MGSQLHVEFTEGCRRVVGTLSSISGIRLRKYWTKYFVTTDDKGALEVVAEKKKTRLLKFKITEF